MLGFPMIYAAFHTANDRYSGIKSPDRFFHYSGRCLYYFRCRTTGGTTIPMMTSRTLATLCTWEKRRKLMRTITQQRTNTKEVISIQETPGEGTCTSTLLNHTSKWEGKETSKGEFTLCSQMAPKINSLLILSTGTVGLSTLWPTGIGLTRFQIIQWMLCSGQS